jgi:hypothetical protein
MAARSDVLKNLVKEPFEFDGKIESYSAWMRSIKLFHAAYKDKFADDIQRILVALSQMKPDIPAGDWAEQFHVENPDTATYGAWTAFEAKLKEVFFD